MGSLAWRAIPAMLIAAAVFATVGGAIASTGGDDGPRSVAVSQPMLGDDVSYNMTLAGDWPYDDEHVGVPFPALRFTWSDGGEFRANDTRLHRADRLDVVAAVAPDEDDEDQEFWTTGLTSLIEAGGSQHLGSTVSGTGSDQGAAQTSVGGLPILTQGGELTVGLRAVEFGPAYLGHCLVLHPLQGRTLAVGDQVTFVPEDCALGSIFGIPADTNFTAVGMDRLAGRHALRLDATNLYAAPSYDGLEEDLGIELGPAVPETLSLWFADGLPSPLRASWTSEVQSATLDLVGFEQGTVPRTTQPPGPPIDVPLAPRPAWTLDDAGVDHPFPLSAAYQAALADPRSPLGAFVQDEPDAYVSSAWDTSDSERGSWWMEVTGEDETLSLVVQQRPCPSPCPSALPWNTLPVHDYLDFGRGERQGPRPSEMPAQTPTVAGLLDLWAAYGDPAFADMPPTWDFTASACNFWDAFEGAPCEAFVDYEVGRQLRDYGAAEPDASTTPPTMRQDWVIASSTLRTWDGDLESLWELDADFAMTSSVGLAGPPPTTPPPAATLRHAEDPLVLTGAFLMPLPQQAGVGAVAVALGLLYWLWPVLKGGGVGLFSRHTQATVLEHPQRARLVQIVEARPGLRFNELREASGLGNGTLSHHVSVLAAHGHVRRLAKGGSTFFFPAVPDKAAETRAVALKSDGARRVLAAIHSAPGRSNLDVAGATGLDPGTVHYHVRRLADAGLVHVRRAGRNTVLDPTPSGAAAAVA